MFNRGMESVSPVLKGRFFILYGSVAAAFSSREGPSSSWVARSLVKEYLASPSTFPASSNHLSSGGDAGSLSPGSVLKRLTFHVGDEAQAPFEVGADRVETPSEFRIAAVFVGTAGVIADIQLVATLGHCWDAQVHLGK